jgi:hypothetical protein
VTDLTPERVRNNDLTGFMLALNAELLAARDELDRLRAELREACEIAHLYRQLILLHNARMHLDRVDAFLARQEKP